MPLQPQLLFFAATNRRRLKHDGTCKFLAHNFQVTKTKHAIVKRRCEAPGDANPQLISYAKPRCWEIWKTGQSAWKWIAPPTAGWQLKNEALERARKATPTSAALYASFPWRKSPNLQHQYSIETPADTHTKRRCCSFACVYIYGSICCEASFSSLHASPITFFSYKRLCCSSHYFHTTIILIYFRHAQQ